MMQFPPALRLLPPMLDPSTESARHEGRGEAERTPLSRRRNLEPRGLEVLWPLRLEPRFVLDLGRELRLDEARRLWRRRRLEERRDLLVDLIQQIIVQVKAVAEVFVVLVVGAVREDGAGVHDAHPTVLHVVVARGRLLLVVLELDVEPLRQRL